MRCSYIHPLTVCGFSLFLLLSASPIAAEDLEKGLIGPYFGDAEFQRPKGIEVLSDFDKVWPGGDGHGSNWSADYEGAIVPPISGEVAFHLKSNHPSKLFIDGKLMVENPGGEFKEETGKVELEEGKETPIRLTYSKVEGEGDDVLALSWSWKGQDKRIVPAEAVRHSPSRFQEIEEAHPELVEPPGRAPEIEIPVTNTIVYSQSGMFAGWPANNGVWVWGNEILVGFTVGGYRENQFGHSIDKSKRTRQALGRSLDGGLTWNLEFPKSLSKGKRGATACPGGIDFTNPNLAIRCKDDSFHLSLDRGKAWEGPYRSVDIGRELTSRTDTLATGKDECYFFLSAKDEGVQSGLQDRAFCSVTRDGGKSFEFLSWMTGEPLTVRSVMPSTVRTAEDRFVSVMRRRIDNRTETSEDIRNWIDAYGSNDGGKTWEFLSKVAETDTGKHNGNPPSLVRLDDGTLCAAYGYRAKPYGIRAKISKDNGKTWGKEIGLRTDAITWDIGYTRSVVREDGKVVSIYYFATQERPEQHIAATIWDPQSVEEGS
jgi:hypothetical protein